MNKLGVIQLIDSLNTGGAEVLAVNIANTLSDKSINSHLCSTRLEGKLYNNIDKNVGYLFLNRKKTIDINSFLKLKKYIISNDISIIHAHSTSVFLAFCIKLLYPKIKIIWHDHYGISQNLNKRPYVSLKIMSVTFKAVISVNNNLKKWAENRLFCENMFLLNNFPLYINLKNVTKLKGIEGKRIIHLAAFREQKDHENLIKAFSIFINKNPTWTLHLVGNIDNTEYTKRILDLIKVLNLKKHIFTYGSCLDIKFILSQASIGVLSSKSEGLPISILEYGLAKLPVIVTDVGECAKVIQNNKSGLVVSPENYIELENALSELANSKDKRKRFGEKHYNNVKEYYSKEKFISQLITIYTN